MRYKGKYVVHHKAKYVGDLENVVYRSKWELDVMKYLDKTPSVLKWASEPFPIQYYNPIKQRPARYFPDFYVESQRPDGTVSRIIIEVKPLKQTKQPRKSKTTTGKSKRRFLRETATFAVNQSKWKAATAFCEDQGWSFKLLTEREIYKGKH